MARNEEKARTQLNRLHNAKQEKQQVDKYFIPPLATLESARDVKRYIPQIRREISFCLRQISKKRFRDHKIEEFKERLDSLKYKYKKFNKKALHLDPNMVSLPGKKHAYISKQKIEEMNERRREALIQNPNGFRHLYGTTDLHIVSEKKPIDWEHVLEKEEKEEEERGKKREREEEEDDEDEEEDEEAVDKFLEDVKFSDDESDDIINNSYNNNNGINNNQAREEDDPDLIPTPLMQQFKKQKKEIDNKERAVHATGLASLMGYGSSDED